MADDSGASWWAWVQEHLDARNWSRADLSRKTGLSETRISRWARGDGATAPSARAVAAALGVPLFDAFVAASIITRAEAEQMTSGQDVTEEHLAQVSTSMLMHELAHRTTERRTAEHHTETGS